MTQSNSCQLLSLWPSHVLIDQLAELEDARETLAHEAEVFYERHTQTSAKMAHRADTVSMMREQPSQALLRLLDAIELRVSEREKSRSIKSRTIQGPRRAVGKMNVLQLNRTWGSMAIDPAQKFEENLQLADLSISVH